MLGSRLTFPASGAFDLPDKQRRRVAAAAAGVGGILTVALYVLGASPGAVFVPFSIGALVALAILPFPTADRWLALALIGTFPLVPPLGLPNLPLAAGVIGIALIRLGRGSTTRWLVRATVIALAVLWVPLAIGLVISSWPAPSMWVRPLALLLIAVAASLLGVLVWSQEERRDRWLDGLGIGVIIVGVSAVLIFSLQHVASVLAVRDGVVGLMGYFRGDLAAAKFADQNNWIIFGGEMTLRAVTPLFPAPNNLGGYLGVTLPLIVARWYLAPVGRWRAVAATAVIVGVLALVLTISRSTWVAAIAATGVAGLGILIRPETRTTLLVDQRTRLVRGAVLIGVVVAIGALGITSVGQPGIENRIVHPLEDPSVQARFEISGAAVEAIQADLFRGVGLGNWTATIPEGEYIHNVYLEYGVAVGLFGGVWAILMVAIPFAAGGLVVVRRRLGDASILGLALVAGATFNATQFWFDDNLLVPQYAWLTCWAIGGSLALLAARRKDELTDSGVHPPIATATPAT